MRNRLKCKLCNSIIESIHRHDFVTCSCGSISVDGGNSSGYTRIIGDIENSVQLDDEGNEIILTNESNSIVPIKDIEQVKDLNEKDQLAFKNINLKINILEEFLSMFEHIKQMRPDLKMTPLTHFDLQWLLERLLVLFRPSP